MHHSGACRRSHLTTGRVIVCPRELLFTARLVPTRIDQQSLAQAAAEVTALLHAAHVGWTVAWSCNIWRVLACRAWLRVLRSALHAAAKCPPPALEPGHLVLRHSVQRHLMLVRLVLCHLGLQQLMLPQLVPRQRELLPAVVCVEWGLAGMSDAGLLSFGGRVLWRGMAGRATRRQVLSQRQHLLGRGLTSGGGDCADRARPLTNVPHAPAGLGE